MCKYLIDYYIGERFIVKFMQIIINLYSRIISYSTDFLVKTNPINDF